MMLVATVLVSFTTLSWALTAESLPKLQAQALNGNVAAQVELGDYYFAKGQCRQALEWYQMAAQRGQYDARSRVAQMYAFGKCSGVPQDIVKGYVLYRKIQQHYSLYPESQSALEDLLLNLEAELDDEQRQTAAQLLQQDWEF